MRVGRAGAVVGVVLALTVAGAPQKKSARLALQARSYEGNGCAFKVTDLKISGMKIVPDEPDACEGYIRFEAENRGHDIKFFVRPGELTDAARLSDDWKHDDRGWHFGEISRVTAATFAGGSAQVGESPATCTGEAAGGPNLRYGAIVSDGKQVAILDGGACEEADPAGLKLLVSAWQFLGMKQ